jgi:putative tricarboxylic transport membrane protein
MEKRQDLLLGLLFVTIGLVAAWMARSYSGAGGTYPMVLGLTLTLLGGLVSLRALRRAAVKRELMTAPANLFIGLVVATGYVALVVPLGFYTASIILMLAMPAALGFRQPIYLILMMAVFIVIVWLVFSIVLEKPLPPEFWSSSRRGG